MVFGKIQKLRIVRTKDFGVYLADLSEQAGSETKDAVLLPTKQVPEGAVEGDEVEVFIYRDSSDRLIATTKTPILTVSEVGKLKVKQLSKIGAFLDMGLEKDVLLPFRETEGSVKEGDDVLVALYADKSGRLAATMRVYKYLKNDSEYKKDDEVTGTIYEIKDMGIFVAVDDKYFGLIPKNEAYGDLHMGDTIQARVVRVREDGKIDLSPRKKAYQQLETDAEFIEKVMIERGGSLPYTDKADPQVIKDDFNFSKNAFKRAVGHLLKEGKIVINDDSIVLKQAE